MAWLAIGGVRLLLGSNKDEFFLKIGKAPLIKVSGYLS
jgi:hypothetical protein